MDPWRKDEMLRIGQTDQERADLRDEARGGAAAFIRDIGEQFIAISHEIQSASTEEEDTQAALHVIRMLEGVKQIANNATQLFGHALGDNTN